jgi:hypothetical protein
MRHRKASPAGRAALERLKRSGRLDQISREASVLATRLVVNDRKIEQAVRKYGG